MMLLAQLTVMLPVVLVAGAVIVTGASMLTVTLTVPVTVLKLVMSVGV